MGHLLWHIWAMMFILPLFLGKRLLASSEPQRLFLIILSVACLIYSPLILYEVRMSPQLSRIIYGYFPHNWLQHVRNDGFRPVVFLHHGLWLASFLALGVLASFALAHRANTKNRGLFLAIGLWLLFVLFLSKSIGALVLTLILIPVILFMRPSTQLFVAALFGAIVVFYPLLRSNDLTPVEMIAEVTEKIDPDRAASFNFRVRNEDLLLEKALQKPIAGWGGWGRSAVFDETGREQTVPDGYWIVAIGLGGWLKYLSEFCLLALPMGLAWVYRKRLKIGVETSALCLILACNLVDLIPNSTITPVTWVLAGAIWGRLEIKNPAQAEEPHTPQTSSRQRNSYTRFADRAGQSRICANRACRPLPG